MTKKTLIEREISRLKEEKKVYSAKIQGIDLRISLLEKDLTKAT